MTHVNTVEEFLEVVLRRVFPTVYEKQKIDVTSKGYRIACPICGDSTTNISEKRGNVYTKTNTYKCFNGGCKVFMSLGNLMARFAMEYDIDMSSIDVNIHSEYTNGSLDITNVGTNAIRDYLFDSGVVNHMPDVNYFVKRLGLEPVSSAPSNSSVYNYVKGRDLFDTGDNIKMFFRDALDNKIYMVNHDFESKRIISISTRDLDKKKFRIYTLSDLLTKIGYDTSLIPDLDIIDQLGNVFNIFNVDFNKPLKITEGPIDGSFLSNYLAIQGITKTNMLFQFVDPLNTYTIFDNDSSGTEAAIEAINNGMHAFLWTNALKHLKKMYSTKINKINRIKDVNNMYSFIKSNSGVDFDTFNMFVDKHFSNHKLDVFSV
jgi:hypothetical protein